mmetsp:Transcript_15073/g.45195  ORF Transcript_15073/g.45195 Transcript_15073/m.45195 type:complete len:220 (-) Transcript_15073:90-749(-)
MSRPRLTIPSPRSRTTRDCMAGRRCITGAGSGACEDTDSHERDFAGPFSALDDEWAFCAASSRPGPGRAASAGFRPGATARSSSSPAVTSPWADRGRRPILGNALSTSRLAARSSLDDSSGSVSRGLPRSVLEPRPIASCGCPAPPTASKAALKAARPSSSDMHRSSPRLLHLAETGRATRVSQVGVQGTQASSERCSACSTSLVGVWGRDAALKQPPC